MRTESIPNHKENRPTSSFLDIAEWPSCGEQNAVYGLVVPKKVSTIQKWTYNSVIHAQLKNLMNKYVMVEPGQIVQKEP